MDGGKIGVAIIVIIIIVKDKSKTADDGWWEDEERTIPAVQAGNLLEGLADRPMPTRESERE